MAEESDGKKKQLGDDEKKEGGAENVKKLAPEKEKALDAAVTALLAADSKTQDEAKQKLVTEFKNSGDPDLALRHLQQQRALTERYAISNDGKGNLLLNPAINAKDIPALNDKEMRTTLTFLITIIGKLLKIVLSPRSLQRMRRFRFSTVAPGGPIGINQFPVGVASGPIGIQFQNNQAQIAAAEHTLEEDPSNLQAQEELAAALKKRQELEDMVDTELKRLRAMAARYNNMSYGSRSLTLRLRQPATFGQWLCMPHRSCSASSTTS
ncbi:hypothetical protein HYR82_04680 [Candidatus Peregrinibacteria bacterium]|nr:hypothetical protein [Candidatus Peregrinibacteria bacterium]